MLWLLLDLSDIDLLTLYAKKGVFFIDAKVFSPDFLKNKTGRYKGYPYRSEVHGEFLYGFSDHFPVYVLMGRLK